MIWKMISLRGKLFEGVIKNLTVRKIHVSKLFRKDHYEILGLKRDATQTDIKNAYFELSKIYHPDRIAATDENLTKFREITAAYEILGNEQSRKLYDRGLIQEGKIGIDEPEDSKDPIIQFYKQRQKKKMSVSEEEKMDAWTKEFYKKARKAGVQKSEIFQSKKPLQKLPNLTITMVSYSLFFSLLVALVALTDREESKIKSFFIGLFEGDSVL